MRRAAVLLGGALITGCGAQPSPPPGVSWAEDVATLVHERCAACHRPGGAAPFALLSYEDAAPRAAQLAEVTRTRYMPPWMPEPTEHAFLGERRLRADELALFERWADAGAPRGDPSREPAPPAPPPVWSLGTPDLVLELEQAYAVPAEGLDDFRCFVLRVPGAAPLYVRAVELLPSQPSVVHHMILASDRHGTARALDDADPGPGFAGMFPEGLGLGNELAGWVPGSSPLVLPEGAAWELTPGQALVLDVHFRPTGRVEHERTRVGLYLDDEPPRSPHYLLGLGCTGVHLPPGDASVVVQNNFELTRDAELWGILPHAHYLCRRTSCVAELPDGQRLVLLDIRAWDFDWQDYFRYVERVALPAGTRLYIRYEYDNSAANPSNPWSPPRRVFSGLRTTDEMAATWLALTLADERARDAVAADAERHTADVVLVGQSQELAWRWVLAQYDADADGSLDPSEDVTASAFVRTLSLDTPLFIEGFDADGDGALDPAESARAQGALDLWLGSSRPTEPGAQSD